MTKYPWKASFGSIGDTFNRLEVALKTPLDEKQLVLDATIHRFEFIFDCF